jgi:hypothetical protein
MNDIRNFCWRQIEFYREMNDLPEDFKNSLPERIDWDAVDRFDSIRDMPDNMVNMVKAGAMVEICDMVDCYFGN